VEVGLLTAFCACVSDQEQEVQATAAALVPNDVNVRPPTGATLPASFSFPGLTEDLVNGAVQNSDALQSTPVSDLQSWAGWVADARLTSPAVAEQLTAATSLVQSASSGGEISHFGYQPEYARWDSLHGFPPGMDEFRQRGARLFCSATEAFRQGPKVPVLMGKRIISRLRILGFDVEYMAVEPSVALEPPQKFLSPSPDGAQVFAIPIAAGSRITPFKGLTNWGFQQQERIVLTTVDAALLNPVENSSTVMYTATHADAFSATHKTFSDQEVIPLFNFGLGAIELEIGSDWGTAACTESDTFSGCRDNPYQMVHRLLVSGAPGYPGVRRGGPTSEPVVINGGLFGEGIVNDGHWALENEGVWIRGFGGPRVWPLAFPQPLFMRAAQNNDKSLELQSTVGLTETVRAAFGPRFGPFQLTAEASGAFTGRLFSIHHIREQVNGVEYSVAGEEGIGLYALPQTDLTVTADQRGEASVRLLLELTLGLDLPLVGYIGFRFKLIDASAADALPAPPAHKMGWPEKNRLRISTAMSDGEGRLNTANIVSHWPNSDIFFAQPQSLADCLAGVTPPPTTGELPPVCSRPPTQANGPIEIRMCFVTPVPSDVTGTLCEGRRYQFATEGASQTLDFRGAQHAVRVLDDAAAEALAAIMAQCAEELASADRMRSQFEPNVVPCNVGGIPFEPTQVIQGVPQDPNTVDAPDPCN
jgi:hypothetical protein